MLALPTPDRALVVDLPNSEQDSGIRDVGFHTLLVLLPVEVSSVRLSLTSYVLYPLDQALASPFGNVCVRTITLVSNLNCSETASFKRALNVIVLTSLIAIM